jgi:antitoxin (DNA-binding transcriptional repressor) of toxin-antitoxin stability system
VILCERNVPIAEIRPISKTHREPRPAAGLYREPIAFGEDFFNADAEIAPDFSPRSD